MYSVHLFLWCFTSLLSNFISWFFHSPSSSLPQHHSPVFSLLSCRSSLPLLPFSFFYLHSNFSSRGLLGTLPPFLCLSFYFCYSLFCPICLVVLLPAVAAHSLDPAYVSIVTLTSSFLCLTSLNFSSFVSTSPSASPPWLVTMLHARECPITASLTLSALCLWPFALCTSNGRGVIHWLICWQPVWQGISFVSLPTMLLLSVCVSEWESVNVSVSLCIWNMFVKLCVYVSVCVCCSMSTGHPSIKLIL